MSEIDFQAINQAALAQCPALLEELLPGGKVVGREYKCSDLSGGNGDSLCVNLDSGIWADFANKDDKGRDLISLVAVKESINQFDAVKILAKRISYHLPDKSNTTRHMKPNIDLHVIMPIPDNSPKPSFIHHKNGEPTETYIYRNEKDQILGFTCRFTLPELEADARMAFRPSQEGKGYLAYTS